MAPEENNCFFNPIFFSIYVHYSFECGKNSINSCRHFYFFFPGKEINLHDITDIILVHFTLYILKFHYFMLL